MGVCEETCERADTKSSGACIYVVRVLHPEGRRGWRGCVCGVCGGERVFGF